MVSVRHVSRAPASSDHIVSAYEVCLPRKVEKRRDPDRLES
jgi:hypothetical protein